MNCEERMDEEMGSKSFWVVGDGMSMVSNVKYCLSAHWQGMSKY